jgi:hypothetical protein
MEAIYKLRLDGYRGPLLTMTDPARRLPRPNVAEIDRRAAVALSLLQSALVVEHDASA